MVSSRTGHIIPSRGCATGYRPGVDLGVMNPINDATWTTACAYILTSPTAREVDLQTCRELLTQQAGHEDSWPIAIAVIGVAVAAAWGLPRLIRELR